MTPKQKAIELIESYLRIRIYRNGESFFMTSWYSAKECAIIAVDAILGTLPASANRTVRDGMTVFDFWTQVRKEL